MHEHIAINALRLSQHFLNDRQHRGICTTNEELRVYLEFAESKYDGRGAKILYLSDKSIRKLKASGMSNAAVQNYEKKKNVRVVVSLDGTLITAMYANKRCQRVR